MLKLIQKILLKNNNEVCWLSHHIPKTAGTSLARTYVNKFGNRNLYRLYNPNEIRAFEKTGKLKRYANELIVHGHFKPTHVQESISKDIRRIVWIRDPVQRAWSMLHHLVAVQKHKAEYKILHDKFGDKLNAINEDVFHFYLTEKQFKHLNKPYFNYFKEVPLAQFYFIGKVESYDADLRKLSNLMGVELEKESRNVRKSKNNINSHDFKCYLEKEYEVVEKYYPF